jgi:RES domain
MLARIYFAAGPHPSRWNTFRSFGPVDARWDHHLPNSRGAAVEQSRAVFYCAPDIDTCVAEVFQATRRIDRARNAPWLVVFALSEPVTLLDLRGTFATTIGASTAIHSGSRSRARAWARGLYEAYPQIQGLHYGSSMNGHASAVVLNERARDALSERPEFHRALNDDILVQTLQHIALRLSYGLR